MLILLTLIVVILFFGLLPLLIQSMAFVLGGFACLVILAIVIKFVAILIPDSGMSLAQYQQHGDALLTLLLGVLAVMGILYVCYRIGDNMNK